MATTTITAGRPITNHWGERVVPQEIKCYLDGVFTDRMVCIDAEQAAELAADWVAQHAA